MVSLHSPPRLLGLLALLAAGLVLHAGPGARAADFVRFDFEAETGGWICEQPGSQVGLTRDPEHVQVGTGALEWTYNPGEEDTRLSLPMPRLPRDAVALEFSVRVSEDACLQLQLYENGGARYVALLRVPAGAWKRVRLALADFTCGAGGDPNNALEPDQVGFLSLMDSTRFHVADAAALARRRLWLDDFTVGPGTPTPRRVTTQAGNRLQVLVDDFDAEHVGWEGAFGQELKLEREGDVTFLRAEYLQGHAVRRLTLTDHVDGRYGAGEAFLVVARSRRPALLRFELREWDGSFEGPRYEGLVELPASQAWQAVRLPVRNFRHVGEKRDPNGRLDLGQVWLLDITDAATADPPVPNRLEVDSIGVVLGA